MQRKDQKGFARSLQNDGIHGLDNNEQYFAEIVDTFDPEIEGAEKMSSLLAGIILVIISYEFLLILLF